MNLECTGVHRNSLPSLTYPFNWEAPATVGTMGRTLRGKRSKKDTEYGGAANGLVQPEPHVPTSSERLMGLYQTDSAEVESAPEFPLVP